MVELQAGPLRCELAPELGGCIAGLWRNHVPVLRSAPAAQIDSARQSGGWPLVPFSNRIGQASLRWEGTQHPLVRQQGDAPHAIHGVGWQRAWNVLDSDGASAMLAYEHQADALWPFAFDCSHTLRLRENALEMTLALTNQSGRAAPAGLGWHPCFSLRPGSRLGFQATGRWELGPDQLPLRRQPAQGLDAEAGTLRADDCFDGWNGQASLRDAALHIRIESGLARLVVYGDPARGELVVAPVSHVANAVHLYAAGAPAADLGLSVLQPGETLVAQMRVVVEAAP